ncbi:MAG: YceD family protein [Burkholderiaceae bacterium]
MRWPDDHRVSVARLARETGVREGLVTLDRLPRLREALADVDRDAPDVSWRTELAIVPRREDEFDLHLFVSARLPLACRRCLEPVLTDVRSERRYRLIADAAVVAGRDEQAEDHEVVWLDPHLDIAALIEDELLLELPMMPVHDTCPEGAIAAALDGESPRNDESPETHNPFSDLAARLKRTPD